jgi:hypothetical protein
MGNRDIAPPFLTSTIDGGELSPPSPGSYIAWERAPGTHFIGGWVDPRASLDDVKRKFLTLPGLDLRPFGRPARSRVLRAIPAPGWVVQVNSHFRTRQQVNQQIARIINFTNQQHNGA